uniref:programmed cell death 1 ligand 1-like n=1 Tax=Semicossyphus pulcher TaxID=241346 RepID=UPI0037E86C46
MDWALVVVLQVIFQPALSAVLFTVEVEQPLYESEFGGDVVMGCRFKPKLSDPRADLKVTWNRIPSASGRHVLWMDNGKEHFESQDPDFQGRVKLLTDELKDGWAKLQISKLRISDSGMYQCLVKTAEGADYKPITLSVKAPYKPVKTDIQKAEEGDKVVLTCQSEGYPLTSVTWKNGKMQEINSDTDFVQTTDQLLKVTSYIRVSSSDKNNYTCSFSNDGYSRTFQVPDDLPPSKESNDALVIIISCLVVILAVVALVMYRRRKGLKVKRGNEEEITIINEGSMEENLGAIVKSRYSDPTFCAEMRHHLEAFNVEELPHRLLNNEGQPGCLQALLPGAGETLFLEGQPGSGKTTLAHILVSSWTAGPTHSFAELLNVSALRLLLYVDCSRAKGDMYQEITTQFSLTGTISTEDKLRTALTLSGEALLLLDGYREGNQCFDESLRRFLREREGCRVLVTACPGHCGTLKEIVGTGQVLELQTQTVKY